MRFCTHRVTAKCRNNLHIDRHDTRSILFPLVKGLACQTSEGAGTPATFMTVIPSIHTPLALKVINHIILTDILQEHLSSSCQCLVLILVSSPSVRAFGDEPWHNSANNYPEYCDNRQSHVHRRVDHLGKLQTEPWTLTDARVWVLVDSKSCDHGSNDVIIRQVRRCAPICGWSNRGWFVSFKRSYTICRRANLQFYKI